MTAQAPCTFIARSVRAACDTAAVHAAAFSASSHPVGAAQLRRVAASQRRQRAAGSVAECAAATGAQRPASSWST